MGENYRQTLLRKHFLILGAGLDMRKKQIDPLAAFPDEPATPKVLADDVSALSSYASSGISAADAIEIETPLGATSQMTAQQRGQHLAARFKEEGIQPVLIFGARASGKTSFIASLFQYIHVSEGSNATLTLDLDAIPNDTKSWQDMRQFATLTYERRVYEFMDQRAAPSNTDALPFFIPVVLRPKEGRERKFAFLEGMGEWYMPDMKADSPHKPFQGEIEGMLRGFNESMTVIYVAPFTTAGYRSSGDKESPQHVDLKERDLGLVGTIQQYQRLRVANFHIDHHLFLFSKWDVRCNGIADREFLKPEGDLLEKIISSRYPLSYALFKNMNLGGSRTQKTVTHYCSGVIDGNAVMKPAAEDQRRLDYFPRKMWNWFYFNTTSIPLYADVHPKPPGIVDKILKALRGR